MKWFSCFLCIASSYAFMYPVLEISKLSTKPKQIWLDGSPYVVYKGSDGLPVVHTDVCPHLGASLSSGTVVDGRIQCPYHGFVFNQGRFCGIGSSSCRGPGGRQMFNVLKTKTDDLYVYASPDGGIGEVYTPPEACDPLFVAVHGSRIMDIPQSLVTENVLDMLHISFVHRFGNPNSLPRCVRFEKLSDTSGRSTFHYTPRVGSLSNVVERDVGVSVHVENEYHLPSTTVTRVRFGDNRVKTVVTRAQPMDYGRTRLYWIVYRNFWNSLLVDPVVRGLMEMTLDEDVAILKTVHLPQPTSNLTVMYDVTALKYREAVLGAQQNQSPNESRTHDLMLTKHTL